MCCIYTKERKEINMGGYIEEVNENGCPVDCPYIDDYPNCYCEEAKEKQEGSEG